MVSRISSSWWKVDVPGNSGCPRSISPNMQPKLHMSTPGVYLGQEGVCTRAGSPGAEAEWACRGRAARTQVAQAGPGHGDLKGEGRLGVQMLPWGRQKHLWSSVPACGHILCQGLAPRPLREVTEGSCQAKVTEFHPASRIQQDVGWLERGMGLRPSGPGTQGEPGTCGHSVDPTF